ncbi:MAG: hypothetical protein ACE5GE_13125 [Phycisphaerae bacterium]
MTFLALLGAVGCHQPVRPAEPVSQQVTLADDGDFDRLWDSAMLALRRHRFELDRVDRRAGLMTTFPVTSQSFFECWRHDVDTAYDLLEASLRTVRRTAEVRIDRMADAGSGLISVTVRRETFATPERQYNNTASTLQIFGDLLPGVQGERQLTGQDDYWIADGRDGAMERRLLHQILSPATASARP